MSSISRKVSLWAEQGLISRQQADEIVAFEQNKKPLLSLFAIISFLGIFSIACGIIAIVSSNWYSIPDAVKLGGMFALLIAVGSALPVIEKKHPVVFDAGLFLLMFLFFAAIGLVGQIYHLKSDTYKAFLFWSGLSFPLLFLTKRILFGCIWEFVFICSVLASPFGEEFLRFVKNYFFSGPLYFSFLCLALFVVLSRVRKAELFVFPAKAGFLFAGFVFLFCSRMRFLGIHPPAVVFYVKTLFLITAAGFAAFVHFYDGFSRHEKQSLWIVTGMYALFFLIPLTKDTVYFSELLLLISFIFVAYTFRREKMARVLAVITAFRILNAFFELFGSLLYTGFGMIFSGLIILGIAYGCYKADGYLKQTVGGKINE